MAIKKPKSSVQEPDGAHRKPAEFTVVAAAAAASADGAAAVPQDR